MNKPALYSRASDVQRHDAVEIVNELAGVLGSEGKQSLLDVGCGCGDVLVEIIAPVLAHGFSRIVGIDVSTNMVAYAAKIYGNLMGVGFKELDIQTDHLPLEFHEQFDRVTSFYCLHWIRNQRKSLENIFKSLRSNGDCLLVYLGSNSVFDAFKILSRHPRWKAYVKDLSHLLTPLLDHPRIGEEYTFLLEQEGFIEPTVQVKEKSFTYEGTAKFKENMKAINVFPLPAADYEEYFDTMCESFEAMGLKENIPGTDDYRFIMKYRLVVAYARKGE